MPPFLAASGVWIFGDRASPLADGSVKKSYPGPWSRLRIGDLRNRPLAEPRPQGAGWQLRMPVGNSVGNADFFTDPDSDARGWDRSQAPEPSATGFVEQAFRLCRTDALGVCLWQGMALPHHADQ